LRVIDIKLDGKKLGTWNFATYTYSELKYKNWKKELWNVK